MIVHAVNDKEPGGLIAAFAPHVGLDVVLACIGELPAPAFGFAVHDPNLLRWIHVVIPPDTDDVTVVVQQPWMSYDELLAVLEKYTADLPPEPPPAALG